MVGIANPLMVPAETQAYENHNRSGHLCFHSQASVPPPVYAHPRSDFCVGAMRFASSARVEVRPDEIEQLKATRKSPESRVAVKREIKREQK